MVGKARLRLTVLALLVAVVVALIAVTSATAAPSLDPVKGKTLWDAGFCKNCHGAQGQGGFAPPLAGTVRTPAQAVAKIRAGTGKMPTFKPEKVSDQDETDIIEYMKTLAAVTGWTAPAVTPAAGDPPGKTLVAQKGCIACHGPTGPVTPLQRSGHPATAQTILTQLRTPANNMPMFKPEQVSDAEAAQVADFVAQGLAAAAAQTPVAQPTPTRPAATTTTPPATTLPRTGGPLPIAVLAGLGAVLAAFGYVIRRRT